MARDAKYDPTTTLGKIRMFIQDTDVSDPRWHDNELSVWIELAGGSTSLTDIYYICHLIFTAESADASRVANILKLGSFGDNESTVYEALKQQAAIYLKRSGRGVSIDPVDVVFTMDRDDGATAGTTHLW